MTLEEFALFVKEKFDVNGVRMVGERNSKVKKSRFLAATEINIFIRQSGKVQMFT